MDLLFCAPEFNSCTLPVGIFNKFWFSLESFFVYLFKGINVNYWDTGNCVYPLKLFFVPFFRKSSAKSKTQFQAQDCQLQCHCTCCNSALFSDNLSQNSCIHLIQNGNIAGHSNDIVRAWSQIYKIETRIWSQFY